MPERHTERGYLSKARLFDLNNLFAMVQNLLPLFLALNLPKSFLFWFSYSLCPIIISFNLIFPLTGPVLTKQSHFPFHSSVHYNLASALNTPLEKKIFKWTHLLTVRFIFHLPLMPAAFNNSHSLLKPLSVGSITLFSWKAVYCSPWMDSTFRLRRHSKLYYLPLVNRKSLKQPCASIFSFVKKRDPGSTTYLIELLRRNSIR